MAHAATSSPVKQKRKRRPKGVCPNPLFLRWLEEYRDEAMNNGSKSSYTYNKVDHVIHLILVFVSNQSMWSAT